MLNSFVLILENFQVYQGNPLFNELPSIYSQPQSIKNFKFKPVSHSFQRSKGRSSSINHVPTNGFYILQTRGLKKSKD